MTREEILKNVTNIVSIITHDEDIKETTHLWDDLHMDSLDKVEMVIMIEKEFLINIPDVQADDIQTIYDLVNIVEKLLLAKK